jgi:hypothetical protein
MSEIQTEKLKNCRYKSAAVKSVSKEMLGNNIEI